MTRSAARNIRLPLPFDVPCDVDFDFDFGWLGLETLFTEGPAFVKS